jgi:hypothetical protein
MNETRSGVFPADSERISSADEMHFCHDVLGFQKGPVNFDYRIEEVGLTSAALSLVGWIPWSALIGIDDPAYDIAQAGSTPQLAALWKGFNGDAVMLTYLLIYVIRDRPPAPVGS